MIFIKIDRYIIITDVRNNTKLKINNNIFKNIFVA